MAADRFFTQPIEIKPREISSADIKTNLKHF